MSRCDDRRQNEEDLELELGPPPVTALGVVSDGVAGPHSDPLRDGTILLQLLSELGLDAESLVSRLKTNIIIINLVINPSILNVS